MFVCFICCWHSSLSASHAVKVRHSRPRLRGLTLIASGADDYNPTTTDKQKKFTNQNKSLKKRKKKRKNEKREKNAQFASVRKILKILLKFWVHKIKEEKKSLKWRCDAIYKQKLPYKLCGNFV